MKSVSESSNVCATPFITKVLLPDKYIEPNTEHRNGKTNFSYCGQLLMIRFVRRLWLTFRERMFSGFAWSVLSAVALQGSVLVSTIIVARLLGLQSFGAYAVLVSTVMTVVTIAQSCSGLVATKYVAEFLSTDPGRVGRVLAMCRVFTLATGAMAALLMSAAADLIASDVLGKPDLAFYVHLIACATLFQVSVVYQYGALQGFGAFREMARAGAIAGVGHIALTAGGAWLGELAGATIGFVLAAAVRMAVFRYTLRGICRTHGIAERPPFDRREFGLIWRFGLPAGLAGLVTTLCLWLVIALVARLPDGLALVAVLAVAHQVRLTVLQLPNMLNAVSFSLLSRLKGQNENANFGSVFWSGVGVSQCFSACVVAVLVLAAEPVLALYGTGFESGRWVLVLLLFSALPEILATSFYQLVQSAGRMWHSLFLIMIPRDLLYLALAAVFLPKYGLVAAAAAYFSAHVVGLVLTLVLALRFAPAAVWARAGRT